MVHLGAASLLGRTAVVLVAVAALLARLSCATQFGLVLAPSQKRCFTEHLNKHVLFTVSVDIEGYRPDVHNVVVTASDPVSNVYSESGREMFRTAFTSVHAGAHIACVSHSSTTASVDLTMTVAWGAEAKDYDIIAKKDHLDVTTTTMTRIEDMLRAYHKGLIYLRSREARLRTTNDSTAQRLIVFCILNIAVVALSVGAQVLYFRNFFRTKKII